ncbi:MAG: phosphatidate cytidylyltransferase [Desulfobacteraceae bacterium]|nr:MAG: phosphatidate cytidylyltransferase [Desulfobacteraceae bacterium]
MQQLKRWITAVILLPFLLAILIKGPAWMLAALIVVVSILTVHEYLAIVIPAQGENSPDHTLPLNIRTVTYAVSAVLPISAFSGSWQVILSVFLLNLLALSLSVLSKFSTNDNIIDMVAKQVLGIVYVPLSLSLLVFIREMDHGMFWIIWLLIIIFANDTGAYYAGTYMGKRSLSPSISPNKTIEGSIGGIVASVIVGAVFNLLYFQEALLALKAIPCAAILAVAGQIGDLFESALKRAGGIKDSGKILPGHGGMLDRIDGLLFAIPVIYVYLVFII